MLFRPLAVACLAALMLMTARPAAAEEWTLDASHTSIVFKVSHLGASDTYGLFKQAAGTFTTGDAPTFDITVNADSIDSGNDKRDQHLKSPDFFNVRQFPTITFKSTSSEKTDAGYRVTGDLTLHGVTKSITVDMTQGAVTSMQGKNITGFSTTFEIDRTDYGMDFMAGPIGEKVTLMVSFEGNN